ncbi:non-ribosomal peptide synthetase [Mesorhizobium sp. 10J20-29]
MQEIIQDIATLLRSRAELHGDLSAIETEAGETVTYSELHRRASSIGASLLSARLKRRGRRPRVGIVLPNGSSMTIALLGITIVGEAAPFNSASTAAEFDMYFENAGIDALLVNSEDDGPAVSIAEKRGIPLLRLSERGQLGGFEGLSAFVSPPKSDDIALVLMTSGSTGRPKLVPLTHMNVCTSARDVCLSLSLGTADRCLSMWEQYHVGGLVDLSLAPLLSGGCIISTSGFNARSFFDLLPAQKPTWFQAVPTTLNELLNQASRNGAALRPNTLRFVRSVAAPLPPALMRDVEELLGAPVIQTFGMTEAGPLIASTALPPAIRKPGSVGRSCGAEIRIFEPAAPEKPRHGEVAVRGANVFHGYENDDAANRSAFRDGWFLTGDIGYFDADGDLFLTGRIKQMINRGGEKINPQEIDDVLLSHPAVAEAASFAVKHRTLGEDVAVGVVLKHPVTTEELQKYLGTQLSSFKVPSRIVVLDRLPRNPVGKIDRLALAGTTEKAHAEVGHVAPRNDLEAFIANLWSEELSAGLVGIYDDFSALGGDSLSSVRIWMALEASLDGVIPKEALANASTVAGLAKALVDSGLSLKGQTAGADSDTPRVKGVASILSAVKAGSVGIENDSRLLVDRLEDVSSPNELRMLQDAMTLYGTPSELSQLLDQTRHGQPGRARSTGIVASIGLRLRQERWRRQLAREIAAAPAASQWKRTVISNDIIHYSNGAADVSEKTLIVGFSGNQMRLMIPTYRILNCIDPGKFDLLLLCDRKRSMFSQGAEGAGSTLEEIVEFARRFVADTNFPRTVSFGTSGGGLPAIHTAVDLGWSKAITVGSASPARSLELAARLKRLAATTASQHTKILATFGANARDADAANQLRSIFPTVSLYPEPRFPQHNLLHELYKNGQLAAFMEMVLND